MNVRGRIFFFFARKVKVVVRRASHMHSEFNEMILILFSMTIRIQVSDGATNRAVVVPLLEGLRGCTF